MRFAFVVCLAASITRDSGRIRRRILGLSRATVPAFCWTWFLIAALSGCASLPAGSNDSNHDPLEPVNRSIFGFNRVLDRVLIKPAAQGYRKVLPQFVRDRIRAVIDNLNEPLVFVNDLLQLRFSAAGTTLGRFVVNSTFGLAGMFDLATAQALPPQSGDVGQTLYVWGVGDGPYLVLPLFGPSNVRDAFGLAGDFFIWPARQIGSPDNRSIFAEVYGITDGIDLRSRNIESLEEIEESALDFYAQLRSITRQRRDAVLREAKPSEPIDVLEDPGASTVPGAGDDRRRQSP